MADLHYLDPYPSAEPAVVLLHGLGADSTSWILQFEPLAEAGFRPIAPDISGFGASPYDGPSWSVDEAAQRIADLLAQLNALPANVVGLSMGGVIAQQMALHFPPLPRRLVLVSTFSYLRPDTIRGWLYFARRAFLVLTRGVAAQARMVAWDLFPDPAQEPIREILIEQICRSDPRVYRTAMRALGRYNSSRRLHEIQVPTLVVTGGRDTTVSPRNQERLIRLIPGAEQVIIPDAGHAVAVDQSDEFNRTLLDFLRRS